MFNIVCPMSLNRSGVNFIVLCMGSDEPDKHFTEAVVDFSTKRYLFPLILNTSRLFVRKLAVAYGSLICLGDFHSAASASSYHAFNGSSLSAWFSQKSRRVFW